MNYPLKKDRFLLYVILQYSVSTDAISSRFLNLLFRKFCLAFHKFLCLFIFQKECLNNFSLLPALRDIFFVFLLIKYSDTRYVHLDSCFVYVSSNIIMLTSLIFQFSLFKTSICNSPFISVGNLQLLVQSLIYCI